MASSGVRPYQSLKAQSAAATESRRVPAKTSPAQTSPASDVARTILAHHEGQRARTGSRQGSREDRLSERAPLRLGPRSSAHVPLTMPTMPPTFSPMENHIQAIGPAPRVVTELEQRALLGGLTAKEGIALVERYRKERDMALAKVRSLEEHFMAFATKSEKKLQAQKAATEFLQKENSRLVREIELLNAEKKQEVLPLPSVPE